MKVLVSILIGMLVVGCGKTENTTVTEPKPLSPEEQKIVGSYEAKKGEDSFKLVLLENRKIEANVTLQEVLKDSEGTWKIVEKEVHVGDEKSLDVFKIEPNGDLTWIGTNHADVNVGGYIHFKKLK